MPNCALITGASSGIGTEFSRQLAAKGIPVVLTGRNLDRLNEIKSELKSAHGTDAPVISCDLARTGGARELYDECERRGIVVDILINNAGLGMFGESVQQDADRIEGLLALNVISLTTLSGLFGAKMKARGSGHILNLGSLGGNQATPYFASYAASKRYVHEYSLALRCELRGTGVHVSCLQPGFVKTNFDKNALIDNYRYLSVSEKGGLSAEQVARIGLRGMFRNQGTIVAGLMNNVTLFLGKLVPGPLKATAIKFGVERLTRQ